jgi:hypothetical protein
LGMRNVALAQGLVSATRRFSSAPIPLGKWWWGLWLWQGLVGAMRRFNSAPRAPLQLCYTMKV